MRKPVAHGASGYATSHFHRVGSVTPVIREKRHYLSCAGKALPVLTGQGLPHPRLPSWHPLQLWLAWIRPWRSASCR